MKSFTFGVIVTIMVQAVTRIVLATRQAELARQDLAAMGESYAKTMRSLANETTP